MTHTDEDALIAGLLAAATRAVEARAGLALLTQQWRAILDAAPDATLFLPVAPLQSVDAVRVNDIVLDPARYEVATGAPGRLRRAGPWPGASGVGAIEIDFTAGYGAAEAVPAPLKQAVRQLAAHFYENRETASETRTYSVPQSIDALLAPYREFRL